MPCGREICSVDSRCKLSWPSVFGCGSHNVGRTCQYSWWSPAGPHYFCISTALTYLVILALLTRRGLSTPSISYSSVSYWRRHVERIPIPDPETCPTRYGDGGGKDDNLAQGGWNVESRRDGDPGFGYLFPPPRLSSSAPFLSLIVHYSPLALFPVRPSARSPHVDQTRRPRQ